MKNKEIFDAKEFYEKEWSFARKDKKKKYLVSLKYFELLAFKIGGMERQELIKIAETYGIKESSLNEGLRKTVGRVQRYIKIMDEWDEFLK